MAATFTLAFLGLVFWLAYNRPPLRTGRLTRQRVDLRRGRRAGGIAITMIAFVYFADHLPAVAAMLLIILMAAGLALSGVVLLLFAHPRGRRRARKEIL
jgi:hypothetical protein